MTVQKKRSFAGHNNLFDERVLLLDVVRSGRVANLVLRQAQELATLTSNFSLFIQSFLIIFVPFTYSTLFNMQIDDFLTKLRSNPESIAFTDTIATIDSNYDFTPVRFTNGTAVNEAGTNSGSCKLFSFAKLQGLSKEETLACFGDYYRVDVLQHPDATNHANIRNFLVTGWEGISFDAEALQPK